MIFGDTPALPPPPYIAKWKLSKAGAQKVAQHAARAPTPVVVDEGVVGCGELLKNEALLDQLGRCALVPDVRTSDQHVACDDTSIVSSTDIHGGASPFSLPLSMIRTCEKLERAHAHADTLHSHITSAAAPGFAIASAVELGGLRELGMELHASASSVGVTTLRQDVSTCKGAARPSSPSPPTSTPTPAVVDQDARIRVSQEDDCRVHNVSFSSSSRARPNARASLHSPVSVLPSAKVSTAFAFVSAILRTKPASYLTRVPRGGLAPCITWGWEGIGTRS
ncbi:hypothetical protein B0H11DRAFT_2247447 [Mycena galericulata]|nr:hypothetical protein B0H11DRAFT_2247447 [Mycena galericulata]